MHTPAILTSWSISRKLTFLLLMFFLSASAIIITTSWFHREHEIWEGENYARFLAQSIAAQQEQITNGTEQMLSTLSQLPEVQRMDPEACNKLFGRLNQRYPFYSIISAATPDGNIFAASIPYYHGVNLSDRAHFKEVKRSLGFSVGEYVLGKISEEQSLHYSFPVLDGNRNIVCILSAAFRLNEYALYIAKVNLPEDTAVGIIDRAGVRLYRLPQNDETSPGKPVPGHSFAILSGSSGDGSFEGLSEDGVNRIYAFKQLRLKDDSSPYLYVVAGISKDTIIQNANREMLVYLLVLGIAAFLALGMAGFLGRYALIKPIDRLVAASERFGKGELGTRSGLPHGHNEVGRLAKSFDEMAVLLELRDLERRAAEKALRESEERYRLLFNSGNDAVFVHEFPSGGLLGRFIEVNDIACERLGYSREELLMLSPHDIDSPDHPPDLPGLMRQLSIQGHATWEGVHVRRDSHRFPVEISIRTFELDGKSVILSTARDITERKEADRALRLTSFSVEHAADPIFWIGPEAQILYANEAASRLLGYSKEELLSMSVPDLDPNFGIEKWPQCFEEWKLGRNLNLESIHRRKDGSTFPVEVNISTLFAEAGFNFVTVKDISERKRAEADREKLEAQLFHAQKMESIGRLAGGVAHDFNNMLGVIMGHAEMALGRIGPAEPFYNNLREIHKAAARSAELTRQLLAFARKQIATPRVLNLNDSISGTLKMLQRLIGENVSLVWQPAPDLWRVKIDPSQLDQIMANLAVNARDAIAERGTLTLKTGNVVIDEVLSSANPEFTPGEYVVLSVNDTGAGMGKDVLDKIFEPFFTTKALGHGTGLGLATVYGIVQQNKGFIRVVSEPGHGATFEIYLPRIEAEAEEEIPQDKESKLHRGSETILLVEDEEPLLLLGETILQHLGYRVLPARTPGEAIRLAEKNQSIRLLMTDVMMPEMNGRELVDRIHEIRPGLRYIYMSGYPSEMIAAGGHLKEDMQFLQKPFTLKEMSERIRKVLES